MKGVPSSKARVGAPHSAVTTDRTFALGDAIRWLFGFVRPECLRLGVVFVLSLLTSMLILAQPWITKLLIDDGLLAGSFSTVVFWCAVMLVAALVGAALGALNRWHYITVSSRVLFSLRSSVYQHLQRLSPAFYVKARGGDLMARLDGDLAEVQRFGVDSGLALANGVLVLCGALALMLGLSWQLSLVALALLPLQVLLLTYLRPRIERLTRDLRERASTISSFFFERLSNIKFIQSVGSEIREADNLDRLQDDYLVGLRRLQMFNLASTTLPTLLTLLGTIAVFIVGGAMVINQSMTLGTLVAFTAYLARATLAFLKNPCWARSR